MPPLKVLEAVRQVIEYTRPYSYLVDINWLIELQKNYNFV